MEKRIVISGLGILASNAKGRQDYWQALKEGRVGYKPITLFDSASYKVKIAGEISDFDATVYMGPKGLRTLDRSTKLIVSAGKLAIADSGLVITDDNTDDVGIAVGTTFGSIKSIVDFDEITLTEGPRFVNPAFFPNTVMNSPASQVSIWCNVQGFNTTVSTGFTASLDAMKYACDFLSLDRAKIVYTGGLEELCYPTFMGFHALQFLSGSKDGQEFINCPFDRRRNGITFGEGACLVAMEDHEHAKSRGADILAEVVSFGYYFDPFRIGKYNPNGKGMIAAMKQALEEGGLGIDDIDLICANANSTLAADKVETLAIQAVFGARAKKIPVTAVKSMVGECYSVSGALSVAAALGAIKEGFIPPTVNYKEPDPDCELNIIAGKSVKQNLKHVLINNFSPTGSHACLILRRYEKES